MSRARIRGAVWLGALGLFLCLGLGPLPALAQSLTQLEGQSDFQRRIGGAVTTTCGGLIAFGTNPGGSSPAGDLLGRCTERVHTGNDIVGAPGTTNSLGLDANDTNDALLCLAHQEFAAAGTQAVGLAHVNFATLEKRLYALREGARGIQIAGLSSTSTEQRPVGMPVFPAGAFAVRPPLAAQAAAREDHLGFFLNGVTAFGDFDGNSEEAGFDFDTWGLTAGLDYRLSDSLVAGAAFGFENTDHDFDRSAGDLDKDTYTTSLYGTWSTGPFYVDGILSYSYLDFDHLKRNITYADIDRTARGSTHGDEWALELGTGARFHRGGWSFGPHARLTYVDIEIDSFEESGAMGLNLRYRSQSIRSLRAVLGGEASYAFSTSFGIVKPYFRVEWEHEFEDDSRHINANYAADPNKTEFFVKTKGPDRDYLNVGGGVSVTFAGAWSAFIDVDGVLALRDVTQTRVVAGGRYTF